jgi:hypothetical protein
METDHSGDGTGFLPVTAPGSPPDFERVKQSKRSTR